MVDMTGPEKVIDLLQAIGTIREQRMFYVDRVVSSRDNERVAVPCVLSNEGRMILELLERTIISVYGQP